MANSPPSKPATPSSSAMPSMQLSRVTTQYDRAEDRIRLLGSNTDNGTLDLWLTQRLLVRIVRVLLECLDQKEAALGVSNPDDPQVKSSLHNFAQQNASASMVKAPPVKARSATRKVLVTALDVRKSDNHVTLAFKLSPEESAQLQFDMVQLRQWLWIVYNQWLKAEWPLAVWPQWIKEAALGADTDDSAPMH